MSTTLSLNVALAYASSAGRGGIVFAIHQGMVDRGAELQWLSQVRLVAAALQLPSLDAAPFIKTRLGCLPLAGTCLCYLHFALVEYSLHPTRTRPRRLRSFGLAVPR